MSENGRSFRIRTVSSTLRRNLSTGVIVIREKISFFIKGKLRTKEIHLFLAPR